MSLTYVIPDIHGRADLLREALAQIAARAAGTVVMLGDYVNKGPDSNGVVARLLTGPLDGFRFVALKGNHDVLMVAGLRDPMKVDAWLAKGGDTALASYGGEAASVPEAHIAWLDARSLLHTDAHRVYVHAGLDPDVALETQTEKTLLWKRYARGDSKGFGNRHIVHGHDNAVDGPLLYEGRSNLDTCAWRTGRLVIGIFDDDTPGGPVDFITVQGAAV